jgi:hypothetical protein
MAAWQAASPYRAIGIYIGGAARACPNAALNNPFWAAAVMAQGWKLLPVYVGPQAPCTRFTVRMSADSYADGLAAGEDAANRAAIAGLPAHSPIYADVEAFQGDVACHDAVRAYLSGWSQRLHARGHRAGLYGNDNSAIVGAAGAAARGQITVDAIWIASWTGSPQLTGFPGIPDNLWSAHQRSHQYLGDHKETWGGVTLEIDSNLVDGPVAP